MTRDDLILSCELLAIRPRKYDSDGWMKVLSALSLAGADVGEIDPTKLPASKKDLDLTTDAIKKRVMHPNAGQALSMLDADRYYSSSEDIRRRMWAAFIEGVESKEFPACVEEIDPILQEYISQNFMYTYGPDGSPLVYKRVIEEPGTIWEEAADSEHVFTKTKGELRHGLVNSMVVRSRAKTVTVCVRQDGKQKVFEHIPYWKLHQKYMPQSMSHVSGSPENIARVQEEFSVFVNTLRREHEGKLNTAELKHGMMEIPKMLAELDANVDNMTFFYRPKIDFPELTNDGNVPAMSYFDLTSITEGPTPDFDGFMEAVVPECRDTLMSAIYATCFAGCRLNQYVWLHGEGGDGKSSLLGAISRYLGPRLVCSLGQTMNSDFGLEEAIGKRMVILSDVKTGLSVKSQLIHNLTGHDIISINRKNKPIISVRLNPVVWIAANEAPDVNFDNRNEARRCLYVKMQEPPIEVKRKFYFTNPDGTLQLDNSGKPINNGYDLEGGLFREMPHILYKCREAFERCCPAPYSVIKSSLGAMQLAEENCLDIEAATFDIYIKESFRFNDRSGRLKTTQIFEAIAYTMREHDGKVNLTNFMKRDIRRLLTTKYGCSRKVIDGIHYLEGISLKEGIDIYYPDDEYMETMKPADPMKPNPKFNVV